MPLSFRLHKYSKALMFLNFASPERQMTRQRFFKWTQPAKSRLRPRLAAPQNRALTGQSRKLSDIGLKPAPRSLTLRVEGRNGPGDDGGFRRRGRAGTSGLGVSIPVS